MNQQLKVAMLRVLRDAGAPIGSARIAEDIRLYGIDLGPRSVRLRLKELAADGLVEFIDNPAHKRSKLLRLTPKGEKTHDELLGHMVDLAEFLAGDMDPEALRITAETLADLRSRLETI